jgi:hypothetical protein
MDNSGSLPEWTHPSETLFIVHSPPFTGVDSQEVDILRRLNDGLIFFIALQRAHRGWIDLIMLLCYRHQKGRIYICLTCLWYSTLARYKAD